MYGGAEWLSIKGILEVRLVRDQPYLLVESILLTSS